MSVLKLSDLNLHNKRVLIREDFNVPIRDGKIQSDLRLQAAIPSLQHILAQKPAQVIIMSHLGRPQEGVFDEALSLQPVAQRLSELLKHPVELYRDWITHPQQLAQNNNHIMLLENVRFNPGELANDVALSQQMAALCDVFVMDAFATVHRAHASTYGVAKFVPIACAGPLLTGELEALASALQKPKPPLLAIVGGAKVSSKLGVLTHLLTKVDQLIIGGGMANTFLAAKGKPVGHSLCENDLLADAKRLLLQAEQHGTTILLPTDVVVATEISETAVPTTKMTNAVSEPELILDIGPQTIQRYIDCIQQAGTIIWNGPVGVFECKPFASGTLAIAQAVADAPAFSMAGGGDTLAALEMAGVQQSISYISTGGGAFLEYLEGKLLPAIAILVEKGNLS